MYARLTSREQYLFKLDSVFQLGVFDAFTGFRIGVLISGIGWSIILFDILLINIIKCVTLSMFKDIFL